MNLSIASKVGQTPGATGTPVIPVAGGDSTVLNPIGANGSFLARVLADVGGTNARFALEVEPGRFSAIAVLPCKAYPRLQDAAIAYLGRPEVRMLSRGVLRHMAIAIANPVDGDVVSMTNHHWSFSIAAMKGELGLDTLVVLNDFTALALALPVLSTQQKVKIGYGQERSGHPLGLLGAGTGLGVSGLIPVGQGWVPLHSEGGHVTFSPRDEREVAILQFAWREREHISAERFLSGMGIETIYRALRWRAGLSVADERLDAAEISRRALDSSCAICVEVIECFCAMLGTVAADLAVTLGARGGIYIGGGIVPKLLPIFSASRFRERFEAKGRMSDYLVQIPTYVITEPYPAFFGVASTLTNLT